MTVKKLSNRTLKRMVRTSYLLEKKGSAVMYLMIDDFRTIVDEVLHNRYIKGNKKQFVKENKKHGIKKQTKIC